MSPTPPLGRLESVPLREAWAREDSHFTPWLAQEGNLELLGDALGMVLELVSQEESVGPFRADILCHDPDGAFVLIENQIERTDHSHLGQVITYAAGLGATSVIWIAQRFTEEHRAALDWLNEISHEGFRFFGVEVELWRIGDSAMAPRFNVIARPNDWTKAVKESTGGATTERQAFRSEFWQAFLEHLERRGSSIGTARTPGRGYLMDWSTGRSGCTLSTVAGFRDKWCGVKLIVQGENGPAVFNELLQSRAEIESELRSPVDWEILENRKARHITMQRDGVDPMDRTAWPEIHAWLADRLELFDTVFRGRLAEL